MGQSDQVELAHSKQTATHGGAKSLKTANIIKSPHKATHGQEKARSQQYHRGQQTLRHKVPQAWGAVKNSQKKNLGATHTPTHVQSMARNIIKGQCCGCGLILILSPLILILSPLACKEHSVTSPVKPDICICK